MSDRLHQALKAAQSEPITPASELLTTLAIFLVPILIITFVFIITKQISKFNLVKKWLIKYKFNVLCKTKIQISLWIALIGSPFMLFFIKYNVFDELPSWTLIFVVLTSTIAITVGRGMKSSGAFKKGSHSN